MWDTSSGTSAASLRQAVADCLALSTEVICIAKHFPERCEWLKLEDAPQVCHTVILYNIPLGLSHIVFVFCFLEVFPPSDT